MREHRRPASYEVMQYWNYSIEQNKQKYKTAQAGKERNIMAIKKTAEVINIEPIQKKLVKIRIVGDSPLITHCWSAKAQREILEKEMNIKKIQKAEKNPYEDFASSMYWLDKMPETITKESLDEAIANGARFGFPLTGVKQAAISAAYRMGWSKDKMSLRGAFFIEPEVTGYYTGELALSEDQKRIDIIPNAFHNEPMIEIKYEKLTMRMDMVRVGMGSADIRYRGEFDNWYADMTISFNEKGDKNIDQIMSMINAGGYICGIGEWRPERDGQYGQFHIDMH